MKFWDTYSIEGLGLDWQKLPLERAAVWLYQVIQTVIPLAAAAQQAAEEAREDFLDGSDRVEDDAEILEAQALQHAKEMAEQTAGYMKIHRELVEALATERARAEEARRSSVHWETIAQSSMVESRRSLLKAAKWEARATKLHQHMKDAWNMYHNEKLQTRGLREILDMLNNKIYAARATEAALLKEIPDE